MHRRRDAGIVRSGSRSGSDDTIDRYGAAAGPLALLVHGAVVNRATMAPLAEALAPRMQVVVPDLPGHGSRRAERFTFEAALRDLEALVAAAGDVPVVVAGDSLGGYLALALAARCGERIAGIVAGGCTFPMSGAAAAGSALTDMPVAALARLAGAAAVESALLRGFVMLGGDPAVATDTAAAGLRLAARGESIAELRRFPLRETIERIRCPITFVNGARDVPIVWFDRYYAGCAQRGRAVRVARTPHGVMVLRPCSVAHEIEAFVWDLVSE